MKTFAITDTVMGLVGDQWHCGVIVNTGYNLEFRWMESDGEITLNVSEVLEWQQFQIVKCNKINLVMDAFCVTMILLISYFLHFMIEL